MVHPNDELIEQFAQGRLSLAEAARWEQHLSSCSECGQKMGHVESDSFMELLKHTPMDGGDPTIASSVVFPELPIELRGHGRYSIQRRLGHGGMGMVYQATHRLMHRSVALKMIRADLLATPLAVTRFRREVQAAASLAHPNIVTAFDAEEVAGVHFLVMEYVEGKSLDELVKQKGPLSSTQVIAIAKQIGQGLQHAHRVGMIHRDIKPNNVMITRQGKVKILDFGLARWSGRAGEKKLPVITHTGTHLGTMMYAAPEQLHSAGDVDARADQYGLGATMVHLLTGEPPPFILDKAIDKTLSLPDETPAALRAIIEKLLSLEPSDRYPSIKAVTDALGELSSDSGIMQPAASPGKGLRYALVGASALVLILMGLLLESYLRGRGSEQARQSVQPGVHPSLPQTLGASPQKKQTVPTNQQTPVSTDTWQSLLPLIQPARDAIAGPWKLNENGLTVEAYAGARLAIPVQVPAEYDLRLAFTRRTGKHTVGVILVHGGKQCTFELDAWEMHLAGFQNVDGKRMTENPTRQEGYQLENNRRYTMLIEVRSNSIKAFLDGHAVSRYSGDGKNLSVDARYWAMPAHSTLGLLSWDGKTVFHTVEWRAR